jgi:hypothetical protein
MDYIGSVYGDAKPRVKKLGAFCQLGNGVGFSERGN